MTHQSLLFRAPMIRANNDGRKTNTRRLPTRLRGFGKITEFGASDTRGYDWHFRCRRMLWHDLTHEELLAALFWRKGDFIWVRETWRIGAFRDISQTTGEGSLLRRPRAKLAIDYLADPEIKRTDWHTIDGDFAERYLTQSWQDCAASKATETGEGYEWDVGQSPCRSRPSIHLPKRFSRTTLRVTDIAIERLHDISDADYLAEGVEAAVAPIAGTDINIDGEYWPGGPRRMFQDLWNSINARTAPWASNPWVIVIRYQVIQKNIAKVAP